MTMDQRRHFAIITKSALVAFLACVFPIVGQSNDDRFPSPADLPAQTGLPDPLATGGPIVIDREYPRSFRHQNGGRFFPMGDTAYFLMGRPADIIEHFIDVRRAHGFNFIRMIAMAEGFWPFGGTPASPDYTLTQNNEGVQRRSWGDFDGGHGLTYEMPPWQGIDYPAQWTATGWDFEAAGLEDCIAEDWSHGKPVLNTEFGYQYEPGYDSDPGYATRQLHQPSTVRKKAWKIATVGGYFAAGFAGTAVRRDWTNRDVDNFHPAALETLYEFFTTKTEYWKLSPHLELVSSQNALLALPGVEYVAYFPRGGANSINLAAGSYRVEWLHPESGKYFPQPSVTASAGDRQFTPPRDPKIGCCTCSRQTSRDDEVGMIRHATSPAARSLLFELQDITRLALQSLADGLQC